MKKAILICLSLSIVIFSGNLFAAEKIQIGVLNFAPFYVVEDGKEPSGTILDNIKLAMKRANLEYEITGYPPKRLYSNLAEGKSHVFLGIKGVPVYDDKVIYSKNKITDIDLRIYARSDTALLKSKEEFKGKKILTIRGYAYGGLIKYLNDPANNIETDPTADHVLAIRKLKAKRANYLLDYRRPTEKALNKIDLPGIQNHPIMLLDIYIIVSKQTPNAQDVLEKLEKAFSDLKAEGKLVGI